MKQFSSIIYISIILITQTYSGTVNELLNSVEISNVQSSHCIIHNSEHEMVTPYVIFHKGPYYDDVTETYDNALEVTVYGDSKLIDSKYDYQNFEATMIAEISTNGIQRITGLSIAKRSLKLKDGSTISVSPNDNTSLIALFSQVLNKKNFRNNRITHDDARFLSRSNIKLSPSTNSIEDINSNLCISDDEN